MSSEDRINYATWVMGCVMGGCGWPIIIPVRAAAGTSQSHLFSLAAQTRQENDPKYRPKDDTIDSNNNNKEKSTNSDGRSTIHQPYTRTWGGRPARKNVLFITNQYNQCFCSVIKDPFYMLLFDLLI